MTILILLQFVVVLAAIWLGARSSGVGLGLWGAVGLLVLVVGFGVTPTSPPIDVMLIILAVIMAASVMDAAGGIDYLVRIAERVIRANPKYITIVAPLTTWTFTFLAGTGHIVYPLLPVIYETAHQSGIRPERPMAVATIASQQAITASPVAAATAAMIGLFSEKGLAQWGLPQILMICVPATLTGVIVAAILSMFVGKDLKDDPEYQARLRSGAIPPPKAAAARPPLKPGATLSAGLFLIGVALVVLFGFFPALRQLPGAKSPLAMPTVIEIVMLSVAAVMLAATKVAVDDVPKTPTLRAGVVAVIGIFGLAWLGDSFIGANQAVIVPAISGITEAAPWTFVLGLFPALRQLPGAKSPLAMPTVIEIAMLSVAAVMLAATKVAVDDVPKTPTLRAGVVAVIGIFGLAWLGDSFIGANQAVIVPAISGITEAAPWTFVLGLFFASVLLYSQAATTRALMPLGLALGIPPQLLIGAFPSVNGYFFIPTYGSLIAAINFDLSGTTQIGKYILNHSFMIPGLVATFVAVLTGLALAKLIF